jgi:hypothetical protein
MIQGPSRRQLLTLGGVVLGVGCVELAFTTKPAVAGPAANGAGQIILEALPSYPAQVLSPNGTVSSAVPHQLAVKIINDDTPLPQGSQVIVSFPDKIYAAMNPPMVFLSGRLVKTTAVTSFNTSTALTDCVITLEEMIPIPSDGSGDLLALLGTVNPHRFPIDLTQPGTSTAMVRTAHHSSDAHCKMRIPRPSLFGPAATPWGVTVAAGWDRQLWGENAEYRYYYPVQVSLTGTGPGKSPAAELIVTADPRIVTDMSVVSAMLNNREYPVTNISVTTRSSTDTIRKVHWRTPVKLGPDDRLNVKLKMVAKSPTGPLPTITHPVVSAAMVNMAVRQTGQLSVSREDSIWQ